MPHLYVPRSRGEAVREVPVRQGPQAGTHQSSIYPVSQLLPTSSSHWEPRRWFQNLSMLLCEMESTAGPCCGDSCYGPIDQVKSSCESVGGVLSSIGSRAISPTLSQLFAPVTLAPGNSPLCKQHCLWLSLHGPWHHPFAVSETRSCSTYCTALD